jgi:hypothetical protein
MLRERRTVPKRRFVWICGQISGGRNLKHQRKKDLTSDGASEGERGKNKILGGSDPTLGALAAAQRHGRRGSLPPKWNSRLPRSVAGSVVGEAVGNSESH